MTVEKRLVESQFGLVQRGSVLSYQLPKLSTRHMVLHLNAPPPPRLPLEDHKMPASECEWVCTEEEHLHLLSLQLSMEMAHKVEEGTRDQRSVHDWHMLWKPRITSSRFREVCHVQGDSSAESLAERIIRAQNKQCKWRRGPKWNLMQQRSILSVPMSITHPCGLVIHPEMPWLGASPDGLVYDPSATPPFGLVEIKCPNVKMAKV